MFFRSFVTLLDAALRYWHSLNKTNNSIHFPTERKLEPRLSWIRLFGWLVTYQIQDRRWNESQPTFDTDELLLLARRTVLALQPFSSQTEAPPAVSEWKLHVVADFSEADTFVFRHSFGAVPSEITILLNSVVNVIFILPADDTNGKNIINALFQMDVCSSLFYLFIGIIFFLTGYENIMTLTPHPVKSNKLV